MKKHFLFNAGERLRALRELTGLSRRAFADRVGMKAKTVENIERGQQRMHDEDFERVCSTYEEFSRWISYEGPVDAERVTWHVAESDLRAALYLVDQHPDLLRVAGVDEQAWRERHHVELQSLQRERSEKAEEETDAQSDD